MEIILIAICVVLVALWMRVSALTKEVARLKAASPGAVSQEAETPAQDPVSQPAGAWGTTGAVETTAPQPPKPSGRAAPNALWTTLSRVGTWLRANAFFAVAAVSLALAGIFFVQYAITNDLLPPIARVILGLTFGLALIGAGEGIRRRAGEGEGSVGTHVPAVLSGAGIVTLFATFALARLAYDLLDPLVSLLGLAATGAGAIVLGWRHGPILTAIGLLGAVAAPFVAGGEGDARVLYPYMIAVSISGLMVDAFRRWVWISVLAVLAPGGAALLISLTAAEEVSLIATLLVIALASVVAPRRSLGPDHPGPTTLTWLTRRRTKSPRPSWEVALPFAAMVGVGAVAARATQVSTLTEAMVIAALLSVTTAALVIWTRRAPGLADLPLPLLIGFGAVLALSWVPLDAARPQPAAPRGPGLSLWWETVMVGLGVLPGLAAFLRSTRSADHPLYFGALASLVPAVTVILLYVFWRPAEALGPWPWTLHILAVAALATLMADRFARVEPGETRHRTALAALSALSLIAFAAGVLLSDAPLTLALGACAVAAAALDRRFNLWLLGLYVSMAVLAIGVRLLILPGLFWAVEAPYLSILIAYGGSALAMAAAWWLMAARDRATPQFVALSGAISTTGLLATILIGRGVEDVVGDVDGHWALSLIGCVWLIVGLTHAARARALPRFKWANRILSGLTLTVAALMLILGLVILSPLADPGEVVRGPWIVNTLLLAYGAPALILMLSIRWAPWPRWGRWVCLALSSALGLAYVGLAIRHIWQGDDMADAVVAQGELYAYTVALILLGAGLLVAALWRRATRLRLAGLTVLGLAVIKVYLVDMTGLEGLMRVLSFLALGLTLVALAWLNRWVAARIGPAPDQETDGSEGAAPPT